MSLILGIVFMAIAYIVFINAPRKTFIERLCWWLVLVISLGLSRVLL